MPEWTQLITLETSNKASSKHAVRTILRYLASLDTKGTDKHFKISLLLGYIWINQKVCHAKFYLLVKIKTFYLLSILFIIQTNTRSYDQEKNRRLRAAFNT